MPRNKSRSAPINAYKAQAERLKAFLANVGVQLKHTHALEAVAHLHGYSNFQTLRAVADQGPNREDQWCVLGFGAGQLPSVTVSHDLDLAYTGFLQQVLMYVCLFPEADYTVSADEDDAALTGIYVFEEEFLVAALVRSMLYADESETPIPRGRVAVDHLRASASQLARALSKRTSGDIQARREQFAHSSVAYGLHRARDEIVRTEKQVQAADEPADQLWEDMLNVRIYITGVARVLDE